MPDTTVVQRLLHKCHKDGCDAAAEFDVRLHLTCRAPGLPPRVVSMNCTIKVCAKHQADVPGYVLNDQNRETITTVLTEHGYPPPDFLDAKFEYLPIAADAVVAKTIRGCNRAGCHNPAQFQIKQRFRRVGQRKSDNRVAELATNLFVCNAHRADTRARDLIAHPKDYETTRAALIKSGMRHPDMDNGEIVFVPIDIEVTL